MAHRFPFLPLRRLSRSSLLAAVLAAIPGAAWAHHAEFMQDRPFLQGMSMPVHGLDHLLALLAAGVLASRMGGGRAWLLIFSVGGAGLLGALLNLAGLNLPECTLCGLLAAVGVLLLRSHAVAPAPAVAALSALLAANAVAFLELAPSQSQGLPMFLSGCTVTIALLVCMGLLAARSFERIHRRADAFLGGALILSSALLLFFPALNEVLIQWIEKA